MTIVNRILQGTLHIEPIAWGEGYRARMQARKTGIYTGMITPYEIGSALEWEYRIGWSVASNELHTSTIHHMQRHLMRSDARPPKATLDNINR